MYTLVLNLTDYISRLCVPSIAKALEAMEVSALPAERVWINFHKGSRTAIYASFLARRTIS
jgi:hypothetical protein